MYVWAQQADGQWRKEHILRRQFKSQKMIVISDEEVQCNALTAKQERCRNPRGMEDLCIAHWNLKFCKGGKCEYAREIKAAKQEQTAYKDEQPQA